MNTTETPVTPERIADLLAQQGYETSLEADGTVRGTWNQVEVGILATADWLSTSCLWDPKTVLGFDTAPFDTRQMLLIMQCEQWNARHIEPRAYPVNRDSDLVVQVDVNFSIRRGMDDEQLAGALAFSLAACVNAHEMLAELMPPII